MSETDLLTNLLRFLSAPPRLAPVYGVPLWAVVRDVLLIGKTRAHELCERLGFDCDLMVRRPEWPDPAFQTIADVCPQCSTIYDGEDGGCPECGEGEEEDPAIQRAEAAVRQWQKEVNES